MYVGTVHSAFGKRSLELIQKEVSVAKTGQSTTRCALGSPVDAEEDPQSERRRFRKPHETFFDYQPQKSSNHPATMDSSRQDWFLREKVAGN